MPTIALAPPADSDRKLYLTETNGHFRAYHKAFGVKIFAKADLWDAAYLKVYDDEAVRRFGEGTRYILQPTSRGFRPLLRVVAPNVTLPSREAALIRQAGTARALNVPYTFISDDKTSRLESLSLAKAGAPSTDVSLRPPALSIVTAALARELDAPGNYSPASSSSTSSPSSLFSAASGSTAPSFDVVRILRDT